MKFSKDDRVPSTIALPATGVARNSTAIRQRSRQPEVGLGRRRLGFPVLFWRAAKFLLKQFEESATVIEPRFIYNLIDRHCSVNQQFLCSAEPHLLDYYRRSLLGDALYASIQAAHTQPKHLSHKFGGKVGVGDVAFYGLQNSLQEVLVIGMKHRSGSVEI